MAMKHRMTKLPETPYDQATPSMCFEALWDSLNAKRGYGWDKNPWVWVIEFRRLP